MNMQFLDLTVNKQLTVYYEDENHQLLISKSDLRRL
jgi:hypothetical protein